MKTRSSTNAYFVTVGARQTRRGGRTFRRVDDRLLESITQKHFSDGFTITAARGGWFDPQRGRFVKEESRQIMVGCRSKKKLERWCRDLGQKLNQQEIVAVKLGAMTAYRIAARGLGPRS